MRGEGHVAGIVVMRDVCQIVVSKPERKTGSEARLILIALIEHQKGYQSASSLYGFPHFLIISSLSSRNIFLSPLSFHVRKYQVKVVSRALIIFIFLDKSREGKSHVHEI
jgi:hypothetical protein